MTRQEHLQWCKDRANKYLDNGDIENGITSMLSDMGKHPETEVPPMLAMVGMLAISQKDMSGARRFVDGFN